MKMLTGFAAVVLLSACSGPTLYVESDTAWTGVVTGEGRNQSSSVEGTGNRSFQLRRGTTCWEFKKATADGNLRVYATKVGNRGTGDDRTSDPFGTVNGCV